MMKNKLLGNTKGIATLIIVVIVVIIVAAAGVTAYVVLSNNNDKNTSDNGGGDSGGSGGGDTPTETLGGPGLQVNESLTYSVSGSMSMTSGTTVLGSSDNALSGTVTITTKQLSNGDYTITITPNVTYDIAGITSGTYTTPETTTVSVLDMSTLGANSFDLSSLTDTEYTATEINQINALSNKYTTSHETLSTPDGNILVEKRTYSYDLNDMLLLDPSLADLGSDMQYNSFNVGMSMWFGQDVLYKMSLHMDVSMSMEGVDAAMVMDGLITLTAHT